MVLRNVPELFGNLSISFHGGNIFENAKFIEAKWKEVYADIPFTYSVYSEAMELQDLGANIIFRSIRAVSICTAPMAQARQFPFKTLLTNTSILTLLKLAFAKWIPTIIKTNLKKRKTNAQSFYFALLFLQE